jgi:hypothetical protein
MKKGPPDTGIEGVDDHFRRMIFVILCPSECLSEAERK